MDAEMKALNEELQSKSEELNSLKVEIEKERKRNASELDNANNELAILRKKLIEAGIE